MPQVADIFEALTGERPIIGEEWIKDAVHDSRNASEGSMFVALKGDRVDGHDYVGQAFKNGAKVALTQQSIGADYYCVDLTKGDTPNAESLRYPVCIICENSLSALQQIAHFWRRQLNIRIVGITGSVGKTTSKEMIYEVLKKDFRTIKSKGNYNNEIGLPLTLMGLNKSHQYAVLEMGFYVPGEIAFLAEIAKPQIGVLTTIGLVHAERAGSQEAIFEGKSELVRALPKNGIAILNADDALVQKMADFSEAEVISYGWKEPADLRAKDVESLGLDGLELTLVYKDEEQRFRVPMMGRHSVYTTLRAAAVGLAAGMNWARIIKGLQEGMDNIRLVSKRAGNGAILLDDTYNASPDSTNAALDLLEEIDGRRIAVLGDMLELGPYEEQGHKLVGSRAAEFAHILVTIGQRAKLIAMSAEEAGMPADRIFQFDDTESALGFLKGMIQGDDVVLLKGSRAMEMEAIAPALEEME